MVLNPLSIFRLSESGPFSHGDDNTDETVFKPAEEKLAYSFRKNIVD